MLKIGDEIGKYLILDHLGSGQFGTVYHVEDRALSVERALKILKIADPKRYIELFEAQIQFKCRHENCVAVNSADVVMINGEYCACIDMELVNQGSLENILNNNFVSVKKSCKIICDVSYGLEHAHGEGVLHKDIKPGNILISDGIGKLSDFGVSEYVGQNGVGSGFAYTTHQPPEFHNQGVITSRSDVYSLGITLFRCLNNIVDWSNEIKNLNNPINALSSGTLISEIGWQPWVPRKIRRIVQKACAPKVEIRYGSVREFRQALERIKWNIDWQRVDDWNWESTGSPKHNARVSLKKLPVFEHLINGRRQSIDTIRLPDLTEGQSYILGFIEATTIA